MNRHLLIALSAGAILALHGCNRPEGAAETAHDVAEAQEEGAKDIAAAKKNASETYAESAADLNEGRAPTLQAEAKAAYEVEVAEIESALRVARERCEGNAPQEKNDCLDRAKADYESKIAAAKARRDGMQEDAEALKEASEPRVGTGNLLAA